MNHSPFLVPVPRRKRQNISVEWREFRECFGRGLYFFLKGKKVLEKISELYLNKVRGGIADVPEIQSRTFHFS